MTSDGAPTPVRVTDHGPVRVVTIDRPERRNAVDSVTAGLLLDAFEVFDADDGASVAVLTGAGGVFCAGADLKALATGDRRPVGEDGPGPMGPTRMRLGKPVIAAIEGPAVAGGLELALWCDLRVAAVDAVLGVYCRRFGVPLVDLGTVRLPRLIGHSRAMDLILTGRGVDGAEAERIGLVNRVASSGGALDDGDRAGHGAGRAARSCACATTGCRRSSSGTSGRTMRCATRSSAAGPRSPAARRWRERPGSPPAPGVTARPPEPDRDGVPFRHGRVRAPEP